MYWEGMFLMSILIPQKIYIILVTIKDSQGAYGEYLIDRQLKLDQGSNMPLKISPFMDNLVINYSNKCKRLIKRRIRIQKLFYKILDECDKLDKQMKNYKMQAVNIENRIIEFEDKIKVNQEILNKLNGYWMNVNETGYVLPEMGVANMTQLKTRINEVENEINNLDCMKSQLHTDLNLIREKPSELSFSQLNKLISSYRYKLDLLYRIINKIEGKYDEYLIYYWHLLCKKLKKYSKKIEIQQPILFSEICEARGNLLITKDNLFIEERTMINERLHNLSSINIRV